MLELTGSILSLYEKTRPELSLMFEVLGSLGGFLADLFGFAVSAETIDEVVSEWLLVSWISKTRRRPTEDIRSEDRTVTLPSMSHRASGDASTSPFGLRPA